MSFNRRPAPTTRSAPFRRAAKIVAVVAAVLVALFTALAVAAVALFAGFMNNLGPEERHHLAPIPIAAEACPYVALMHEAANRFQVAYPLLGISYDAQMHPLAWPQTRERLSHAADVLEFSISTGIPHFPVQVQRYLEFARAEVRAGRPHLLAASNASDLFSRTSELEQDGELAFGYAGDLIGHQCSVQLGADTDTDPLTPDPTTASRPSP